jgi:2-iminobutanoate/2-iminopropanoate deaminase
MNISSQKANRKYWIWFLIGVLIALLPWIVLAQDKTIRKQKFNINKEMEDGIGYAQAVKVGKTLYVSGSVGEGAMDQSVKTVYEELAKTLLAYGLTFKNVVKENVFTTDLEAFKMQQELRKTYYKNDFPAATWVQVQQLYSKQLNLEVELIAELP